MSLTLRPRLLVLGLDGLPYSLAKILCAQGVLPNLATLALTDQAQPLRAELPELSPVNWTSFYTAAPPQEHGIFGFTRLHPVTYEISLTTAQHVLCPTIFQHLGERGLLSKVINLPNTYPAQPLNGMLIAGFVAPELKRAVYPPFLAGPLTGAGYKLEADTERGKEDPSFLLKELHATLVSRRKAFDMLWPDMAWDLFVFVLTETDRLFHFLFPAITHAASPWHGPCLEFLHAWDALIGHVLERFHDVPDPKRLLVLADHGFTELRTEVDINSWLRRNDFLRLDKAPQEVEYELDITCLHPESKAFALDPGRVYVHTKQRFARGTVPETAVPSLVNEIRHGLMDLTFEGEPVMENVFTAAELYPEYEQFAHVGFSQYQVPDLVCQTRPGFDCKAKFNRTEIFGIHGRFGAHTSGDAFYYDSHPATDRKVTHVHHVGQEVIQFFNCQRDALCP